MAPMQKLSRIAAAPSRTRFRITMWTVGVSIIIQALLGCGVVLFQRSVLDSLFNERLDASSRLAATELGQLDSPLDQATLRRTAIKLAGLSSDPYVITIYDTQGNPAVSTQDRTPTLQELGFRVIDGRVDLQVLRLNLTIDNSPGNNPAGTGSSTLAADGSPAAASRTYIEPARALVRPLRSSSGELQVLYVATGDHQFVQLISIMTTGFLLALAASAIGTGVAAWFISGIALSPLTELRNMLRMLAPETIRDEMRVQATTNELATFQRDLSDTRERLRQAFQAQDRLIANASHELKTPIAVIMTQAETLDLRNMPEEAVMFIHSVRDEMRRLGQTTENFVMLSRIRGGRTISSPRLCLVNDFVLEAVGRCATLAARRHVALRIQVDEAGDEISVVGDVHLLRTMVEHLLSTAIRVSPEQKEVSIVVARAADRCLILINDQGDSLPQESLATLFDRYAEPESSCSGRRDLGLAIALGIAELHNGHISARSIPEGGCRYTVELPLNGQPSGGFGAEQYGSVDANAPTRTLGADHYCGPSGQKDTHQGSTVVPSARPSSR